ncbi:tetratricopeptide repeat protein [Luteolibacter sp. SL250]|uniref:tetratricopeptide repeat protein n=1 Tax=Luteolibacter sp. SL250 TaxID=2995170 RepID=UPI00226D4993|nr:tetratricopeptide repeat protein [Luteolibacter sp. SL250]WAC18657.1 tetratricopeptide repeat protein [Luteolibacter sp. SL250]
MKLPLFLLLTISPLSDAAGQEGDEFRYGESALADGLWDVAALHFERLLATSDLEPEAKIRVAYRLAEAWIRNGEPAKAMDLLSQSFVAGDPSVHFWKGQALAGLGRLNEAEEELAKATIPGHAFTVEATLTRAALMLSLNQPEEALAGLRELAASADPAVSFEAKIRQTGILLDLRRVEEARRTMPPLDGLPARKAQEASYLEARLLLAENKPAEAAERFFTLMNQRSGQSLVHHHAAVLGYADSLAARDKKTEASDALLAFIQANPASPLLPEAFSRLIAWLPSEPPVTHPVLVRLEEWATPAGAVPTTARSGLIEGLITPDPVGSAGPWPTAAEAPPLRIEATFALAEGLHRVSGPVQKAQAVRLMRWIGLNHPLHPLAAKAWLQSAKWLLEEGKGERAFAILGYLRSGSPTPPEGAEAAFIQAEEVYQQGDFKAAGRLFEEAASEMAEKQDADRARLNASLSRFRESGIMTTAFTAPDGKPAENPALEADLELEQALAVKPPEEAQAAIETFIRKHPQHPRVAEARLAAAEAALIVRRDETYAKAQLDTIAEDPAALASIPQERYALARLKLTELSGDTAGTINAAKAFIAAFPGHPAAAEAALTLGRTLYDTGSYNDAQLILQQLAKDDTDPVRTQAALLLAASSAARVGTPQSREEALTLFDRAGGVKGPLNALVMMKKAQLMIELNRLDEATAFLRKWYQSLPAEDSLRLPAGFLFGDAAYAQGNKNPAVLAESLAIYDDLLKHPETKPADVHRIQYLRGKTLEQLPRTDDPTQKRESEALAAYYSVLKNAENPPAEWHFLESSGFRALEILERAGEKKARQALSIAREIAALKGPRSKEAADRARDIQLKNQIWED